MTLFITESASKERVIRDTIGSDRYRFTSTAGRLFDLEAPSLSHYRNLEECLWYAIRPEKVDYIRSAIRQYNRILVATDPDIEGEVIAWQIQQIARHENPGANIEKVDLEALTATAIEKAIRNARPINADKAQSGISRRIFDSFSQLFYPEHVIQEKPYLKGSYGRVTSPLLGSIGQHPLPHSLIEISRPNAPTAIEIEISGKRDVEKLCHDLAMAPSPIYQLIETNDQAPDQHGLTYANALTQSMDALNIDAEQGHQSLQNLYERGAISYHRTDNPHVPNEYAQDLSRMLQDEGARNIHMEALNKEHNTDRVQEGHCAIIPFEKPKSIWDNPRDLPCDEAVLSLIWRYWSINAQPFYCRKVTATLHPEAVENQFWLSLEKEYGVRIQHQHQKLVSPNGAEKPWNPKNMPMGVNKKKSLNNTMSITALNMQSQLIKRMIDTDLARPSTYHLHAGKMAKRFITNQGILKGPGFSALNQTRHLAPSSLDPVIMSDIEKSLHRPHSPEKASEMINQGLELCGLKPMFEDRLKHTVDSEQKPGIGDHEKTPRPIRHEFPGLSM